MKQAFTVFFMCLMTSFSFAQESTPNLDFEVLDGDTAQGWNDFGKGDYTIHYDNDNTQHGAVSASIESTNDEGQFRAIGFNIPATFGGKKIKLTGYLKTENVAGGWAGLWMRIDPNVAFDNMQSRGVQGTNDWTKYEIELDINNSAKTVVVGGILVGTGKVWVDNLEITIDGQPLDKAPERELSAAQKDTAFDKGSLITETALQKTSVENLELLGKIWGFLKYHHPAIGTGDYNWDYELFRILPKYIKAKNTTARDQVLLDWIASYGTISKCDSCKPVDPDAFLKPDLNWIDTSNLSSKLKEQLHYIQENRHQGGHYYIGMHAGVGNPEFKNENSYANMTYPDAGFRLLALYRYWNIIHYYFPYKHLIDINWNDNLKAYIPAFIKAKDELSYEKVMTKLIGDVKDTHANLWGGNDQFQKEKGYFYPPIHVRFVEDQLTIIDYYNPEDASKLGLNIGDVITHIDGKTITSIINDVKDYYPASNQPTRLRDIGFDILRSQDSSSTITVKRNNKTFEKTLALKNQDKVKGYYRWYRRDKDGKSFKMLDNNIGYITLKNIKNEDVAAIKKEFKNTKGIIIDIRNYPSAFMPFQLGSYFVSEDTAFVKFTGGNVNTPGEFTFGNNLEIPSYGPTYQGKVVVLLDEISQSQAEYTAMAFRAGDNTTIIGSTTAGADGNVSRISLPGGMNTMISGIGVYYPDGKETQRIGIVPDIEIKPSLKGIKEGRDELLEKALEVIATDINRQPKIKD
jgi:C-terminal processing protease CtpA/Prc